MFWNGKAYISRQKSKQRLNLWVRLNINYKYKYYSESNVLNKESWLFHWRMLKVFQKVTKNQESEKILSFLISKKDYLRVYWLYK